MRDLFAIITGIGFLIAVYLFLSRSDESVKIINSLATNATKGIATLQGR